MTAQEDLKTALRTVVAPALRTHGFKGSGSTWVLTADNGDAAVVNVQSSQYSTSAEVRCVVNLAVVPKPWWDWQRARMPNIKFTTPKERDGLWRDRLHPRGSPAGKDGWWRVAKERDAKAAAADIAQQLESSGIPTLRRLLHRAELIASVRDKDLGFFKGEQHRMLFDRALAVLLSDEPCAELDELLRQLDTSPGDGMGVSTRELTDWVRACVAARAGT